ncbi:homoserine O-succinyltransferase [Helicobacter sp. 13S00477-4]|uniref:homoserine O-succinyltransferase n=1 Tax=Helicobacter sp. 13S00477-4 TaxID=1905759 RepID=UPI000BA567E1|nr:homoserine O-succinyltransferase [Helicobacter sp. 13S00477-4]PAF51627.1 homoserine O-succinyltransferase [Helicobacter sp. 13S00477-4]
MPVIIPQDIPAFKALQDENVFVMSSGRASKQDIRPIEIAIFNLMPTKIQTESQLIRLLANSPLQVNITLITTRSYESKNTPKSHLDKFYCYFDEVREKNFDGMIITGAPVEKMAFEEVSYWEEMKQVLDFAHNNVNSTLYICWGAMAGLYYHYGIGKQNLDKKIFGVFCNARKNVSDVLFTGCDDKIYMPHSRYSSINEKELFLNDKLCILCEDDEVGVGILKSIDNKKIFIIGHLEYDAYSLKDEYDRDKQKGLDIDEPKNYFDKNNCVLVNWRAGASLIFSNWLNYYVYQVTPYDLTQFNCNSSPTGQ